MVSLFIYSTIAIQGGAVLGSFVVHCNLANPSYISIKRWVSRVMGTIVMHHISVYIIGE